MLSKLLGKLLYSIVTKLVVATIVALKYTSCAEDIWPGRVGVIDGLLGYSAFLQLRAKSKRSRFIKVLLLLLVLGAI